MTLSMQVSRWLLQRRPRWSAFPGIVALAFLVLTPAAGFAQSSIAGVVTDASNAVLPGVTVEASSPALIEKVRTVVTDGNGRFQLVDLRPGVYNVTFSLAGFKSVVREGLSLPATFTATVNAQMSVGGLEETITVTGESPVVDVQRTAAGTTFSKEVMDAIPTTRMPTSYAVFIPAVQSNIATAAATGPAINGLVVHGSEQFEALMTIDGFDIRNMNNSGGGAFFYYPNQGMTQEVTVTTGAAGAESQMASITTNVIPRDGGNTFAATFNGAYNNGSMQGDNLNDELGAQGVRLSGLKAQWDWNPAGGGPIVQNKVWFWGAYRNWGTTQVLHRDVLQQGPQLLGVRAGSQPAGARQGEERQQGYSFDVAGLAEAQGQRLLRLPAFHALLPELWQDDHARGDHLVADPSEQPDCR